MDPRKAIDWLRDAARESGRDFKKRDEAVMSLHEALDLASLAETLTKRNATTEREIETLKKRAAELDGCPMLLCPYEQEAAQLRAEVATLTATVESVKALCMDDKTDPSELLACVERAVHPVPVDGAEKP